MSLRGPKFSSARDPAKLGTEKLNAQESRGRLGLSPRFCFQHYNASMSPTSTSETQSQGNARRKHFSGSLSGDCESWQRAEKAEDSSRVFNASALTSWYILGSRHICRIAANDRHLKSLRLLSTVIFLPTSQLLEDSSCVQAMRDINLS